MLDPVAVRKAMRNLEDKVAAADPAIVAQVKRDIEIEAHNAKIDQAKAQKRKAKRLNKTLAKAKPRDGGGYVAFVHPSREADLRG